MPPNTIKSNTLWCWDAVHHVGGRTAGRVAVDGIGPRHIIGAEFREFVAGQPQNVCAGIQGYKVTRGALDS